MQWICLECAAIKQSLVPIGHQPTWNDGTCDVCKVKKWVTEPRDFRPRPDRFDDPDTEKPVDIPPGYDAALAKLFEQGTR